MIARRVPRTAAGWRVIAIGAAESIVPLYVAFSCLMLAWLLVAAGMRRKP